MKSLSSPGSAVGSIEPLESRIAPAVILAGNPNGTTDTEYTEANGPFKNIATGTDLISTSVRGSGPVDANAYHLVLTAGDSLKIFNTSGGFEDYLVVTSGNVVAYFVDVGVIGEVEKGELVSISMGQNAGFILNSGLVGDILTNLDEKGTATTSDDSISMTGLVSGQQGIRAINIGGGNVGGKIMAGGNITNVSVNGTVGAILAGSAVNRLTPAGETFDLLPGVDGGAGSVSFTPDAGKSGSSISHIFLDGIGSTTVVGADARIEAGGGGAGAAGGSVSNVRIVEDFSGFSILAGAGGAGSVGGKTSGGAGGAINSIYIAGIADPTPNDLILIGAGAGGAAAPGTSGNGGKGGALSQVYVGFQLISGKPFQTFDPLNDNIQLYAGAGGIGKNGGAGGKVSGVDVVNTAPDGDGDEISVIAGAGGDSNATGAGKGGAGGSLTGVRARDLALEGAVPLELTVFLQAGSGGAGTASANGGKGGAVSNSTVVGAEFSVLAGNGGNGKVGGVGGGITNIDAPLSEGVVSHSATFSAGFGGNGGTGNGGKGGSIKAVSNEFGDFTEYLINSGNAANGGNSAQAKGGAGGKVSNLDLFDGDTGVGAGGIFNVRTGDGGDGLKGGGAGGALTLSQFISLDMNMNVRTGAGGDAIGAGANASGGKSGSLSRVQIQSEIAIDTPVDVTVATGAGGNGLGVKGAGGDAGDMKSLNVRYSGSVAIQAGNGGSGDGGAAGDGGSISVSGAFGAEGVPGDGLMTAGNAGTNGTGPGTGGSIKGTSATRLTGLYANNDLTIQAGNGSNGGAGGSISFVGYGGTNTDTLEPTPQGNIVIQSGAGSAEGRFAGAGGAIKSVSGSVASGDTSVTSILAGDGAGNPAASKSSAGGSITELTVFLGGAAGAELVIKAGDAGNASASVAKGAKGGELKAISVSEIAPETLLRSIAAGNGGAAGQKGGTGGSVSNVRVFNHEIGVLTGEVYGYATMGGVFVGTGGNAATDGKAGSVNGLSATAIAAIVAGREATPALVERVENVYIGTPTSTGKPLTDLLLVRDGDVDPSDNGADGDSDVYGAYVLDRYLAGNFVGAVVDPERVDANQFLYTDTNNDGKFNAGDIPIDGLIAAKVFDQKTVNFTPEASLIGAVLNDWDNLVV
jgi:hypothetical protein